MFRKPKTKNIRQRSRIDHDDNEDDDSEKFNTPALKYEGKKKNYEVVDFKDDDDNNDENATDFTTKSKSILSFAEDEGTFFLFY